MQGRKHSNPRIFKVTSTLISMLDSLPKDSQSVFRRVNLSSFRSNYTRQRKRIAIKLKDPRILKITFHSIRHWYGTTLYHKTKDILLVKQRLGHKKIDNTLLYVQLADFESEDDFICRTASTVEEAKELIEAGSEFVTDMEDVKLFRKRK